MTKIFLVFISTVLLIQFCKNPVIQDKDTTEIYALITDSLIKAFDKDTLSIFIQDSTHMEYEYKTFNDTLFSYFKYDLPETDSAMVNNFINNNLNPSAINVYDIFSHNHLNYLSSAYIKDKQIDLVNDDYYFAMNINFSGIGFTKNKHGAVSFYNMMLNKKGWQPGGETGYFLLKKVNNTWVVATRRSTGPII